MNPDLLPDTTTSIGEVGEESGGFSSGSSGEDTAAATGALNPTSSKVDPRYVMELCYITR